MGTLRASCSCNVEVTSFRSQKHMPDDIRFLWAEHPTIFAVLSRADPSNKLPAIADVGQDFRRVWARGRAARAQQATCSTLKVDT